MVGAPMVAEAVPATREPEVDAAVAVVAMSAEAHRPEIPTEREPVAMSAPVHRRCVRPSYLASAEPSTGV